MSAADWTTARIQDAEQLASVLSEKLDDDAPLNVRTRWLPLAEDLWCRITPILDADGLPVVRTVGDLTARHIGKRVRTVECEGVLDFIGRERCRFECLLDLDDRPDPRTYGQWLPLDTPCEVLP